MAKQVQVWEFRESHENYDPEVLTKMLNKLAKKWTFQLEKGEESGYVHWQGRMSLWKVKRKTELMNLMQGMNMKVPAYLEPTTTKEHKKEAFYCMKEDTRVEGPWSDRDQPAYVPRQYRSIELWPWQQAVVDSRKEFDFRTVDCIVDYKGCTGKSTLASLVDLNYGGIDMPTTNDGEKLTQSLCNILIAKDCRDPGLVMFDMPRSQNKDKLYGLYTAIEQVKKGKVWDMRNSYKEWWFDSPRIWVFTNAMPETNLLSQDRWRFWEINTKKELVKWNSLGVDRGGI